LLGLSFFPFSFGKKLLRERRKRKELTIFLTLKISKKMKTAESANGVQGTTTQKKETVNRTQNRPSITGKEAKDETPTNQPPAEAPKGEEAKTAEIKTGNSATVDNQPADFGAQPEKQELKAEEQPKTEPKPGLTLEAKLKAVDNLHRKSIQRLALIGRMKQLEGFEVALIEENDELESNPYQGCKLIIKDDKNREFTTVTPGLIRMVAQFIFDACNEKLEEIESTIVFPTI
jgi:hypothetical protein